MSLIFLGLFSCYLCSCLISPNIKPSIFIYTSQNIVITNTISIIAFWLYKFSFLFAFVFLIFSFPLFLFTYYYKILINFFTHIFHYPYCGIYIFSLINIHFLIYCLCSPWRTCCSSIIIYMWHIVKCFGSYFTYTIWYCYT